MDATQVDGHNANQEKEWRWSPSPGAIWRDMDLKYRDTAATSRHRKSPQELAGGRSFSGGVAVVVRWAKGPDPGFHCRAVPGDPTSSELYPARKLPGLLEPRYVLVRVGYAIDRLQALLVDESVVSHRNSPC